MSKVFEVFERDIFIVDKDAETVTEVFFNPDSVCGGTLEFNTFEFKYLKKLYAEAYGDPKAFWESIYDEYRQECADIGDDPEKIGWAAKQLSQETPFVGMTSETVFGIMKEIGFSFKEARWVDEAYEPTGEKLAKCSGCGYVERVFNKELCSTWHYCPNCGASMK